MNLRTQRRLAADILGVGEGRVWIDPQRVEEVSSAITRAEIRALIAKGAIKALPEKGTSRGRARERHRKRRKGRRRGPGSRQGAKGAREGKKEKWVRLIRALRRRLRELRDSKLITRKTYRRLYMLAKGGAFKSVSHMEAYIESAGLLRHRPAAKRRA